MIGIRDCHGQRDRRRHLRSWMEIRCLAPRAGLALGLLLASCGASEPDDTLEPPQCNYMGTLYDDGEVFPAADGCNSCKCNPTGETPGEWGCSTIACHDAGPADAQVANPR